MPAKQKNLGVLCSDIEIYDVSASPECLSCFILGLGMENIGGIFVVLICGLIVAIFMAMLEFLWSLRHSEQSEVGPGSVLRGQGVVIAVCGVSQGKSRTQSEEQSKPGHLKHRTGLVLWAGSKIHELFTHCKVVEMLQGLLSGSKMCTISRYLSWRWDLYLQQVCADLGMKSTQESLMRGRVGLNQV